MTAIIKRSAATKYLVQRNSIDQKIKCANLQDATISHIFLKEKFNVNRKIRILCDVNVNLS